jgi:hypothetical protein
LSLSAYKISFAQIIITTTKERIKGILTFTLHLHFVPTLPLLAFNMKVSDLIIAFNHFGSEKKKLSNFASQYSADFEKKSDSERIEFDVELEGLKKRKFLIQTGPIL